MENDLTLPTIPKEAKPFNPAEPPTQRYYRRIIRIVAEDSPNVKRAFYQRDVLGIEPTGEMILQGVLPWDEYVKRRATWDPMRQCIGLDAQFYEGSELLLFPPEWLNMAEMVARNLEGKPRKAEGIGIDPAEGGDETSMCAVDRYGIIEIISKKTPRTEYIPGEALAFMRKHGVHQDRVILDQGGGGTQAAGQMRLQGVMVRTVAFGSPVTPPLKRGHKRQTFWEQTGEKEQRYTYFNKRAELYGGIRNMIDPSYNPLGFGIPRQYTTLRQELTPIPLLYDAEGRLFLLPKRKPKKSKDAEGKESKSDTLIGLIGHSPDQADALSLALYAMTKQINRPRAGFA